MRRVLIVMENEDALVESASDSASLQVDDETGDIDVEAYGYESTRSIASASKQAAELPANMMIDDTYPAVPIGDGKSDQGFAAVEPSESANFVVRAVVPEEIAMEGYVNGKPVYSDIDIAAFPICPGDPAHGDADDVRTLHNMAAVHARGHRGDRVAVAIMDTGISAAHLTGLGLPNSAVDRSVLWNPIEMIVRQGRAIPAGGHPAGHGTMCAFDALIAAPEARLLDYPIISQMGGAGGSSIMAGALSDALKAYSDLEAFWSVSFGPNRQNYDSLVVNNSWGVYHPDWDFAEGHPGRYIDNPDHPFNQRVASLAARNVDIVFAAGNCGSECPASKCHGVVTHSIRGANAHHDVLTLAGVDVSGGRIGYSSEGPPIPGMGADEKPDLACATHFQGSNVGGFPDSGTSAACPVAAGCVAALRSGMPQNTLASSAMFDALRQTTQEAQAGSDWNPQNGFGIVDMDAAANHLGI